MIEDLFETVHGNETHIKRTNRGKGYLVVRLAMRELTDTSLYEVEGITEVTKPENTKYR